MKSNIFKTSVFINTFIIFILFCVTGGAQNPVKNSNKETLTSEFIFPLQSLHVHSSSIVELPDGGLLACWFEGSGERTANDVMIKGARLKKGESKWSETFVLADTPGHPDYNPIRMSSQNYTQIVFISATNSRINSIRKTFVH